MEGEAGAGGSDPDQHNSANVKQEKSRNLSSTSWNREKLCETEIKGIRGGIRGEHLAGPDPDQASDVELTKWTLCPQQQQRPLARAATETGRKSWEMNG